MGRVVHFEITAEDVARAVKFYEVFGWKITDSGMPGTDYWLADTGPEGDMGINGAIMPRKLNPQPVIHWVSVDNLDEMITKVEAAGGKIVGEKQTVPGIGDTIYASDTEGNTFGMIQALPRSE
jgi:predicted enzyme related to lactoylglutathione lyase